MAKEEKESTVGTDDAGKFNPGRPNGDMQTAAIGPKMAGSGDTEILAGKEGLIERTLEDPAKTRQAGGPDAGDEATEEATPGPKASDAKLAGPKK